MPKSYQSHMMIFLEDLIHLCCLFCIELCQIVVTLERILFMLSWSRFTCTPYTHLLCFFEKLASYHPLIPQNKCSTICVGLSLSPVFVGTWRSMKKKKEKRRYPCSQKNLYRVRDHTKGVSISSTTIHTHAHLDLIVWLVFLFGPGFWLCNTCDTSMPYPSYSTLSSTYSHN